MLEELDVPYETRVIEYGEQMKTEPYISLNPMGKVPTIVHGDEVVTECAAADVYVGSHIGWGLQFNTIPERKEFIDYFSKLKERPALLKANQLDDALVEERT